LLFAGHGRLVVVLLRFLILHSSELVDLLLKLLQRLYVNFLFAQRTLVLFLHPLLNAFTVKVVADVAGKRSDGVPFVEVFKANAARFLVLEFCWVVTNVSQRLDDPFLERLAFAFIKQSPSNQPCDAWAKQDQEGEHAQHQKGSRNDHDGDCEIHRHAVGRVGFVAVLCEQVKTRKSVDPPASRQAGCQELEYKFSMLKHVVRRREISSEQSAHQIGQQHNKQKFLVVGRCLELTSTRFPGPYE
jgi:hypothetical protein